MKLIRISISICTTLHCICLRRRLIFFLVTERENSAVLYQIDGISRLKSKRVTSAGIYIYKLILLKSFLKQPFIVSHFLATKTFAIFHRNTLGLKVISCNCERDAALHYVARSLAFTITII